MGNDLLLLKEVCEELYECLKKIHTAQCFDRNLKNLYFLIEESLPIDKYLKAKNDGEL